MERPERGADGATDGLAPAARWMAMLPTSFVVLALLALLVGPLVMQSPIQELTEEIETAADPARTAVSRIQYLLARQTSSLRGYRISGEPRFLRQFEAFAKEEQEVYESLEQAVARLGPDVAAGLADLRARSDQWHEDLSEELQADEEATPPVGLPFDMDDYLAALDAATRFDAALANATSERQREIRAAEDRMRLVQMGLVAIALMAAVTTARLEFRMRRFAAAAEVGRNRAERALQESRRAVQARTSLIRGVTHDVKNPLGAADGYAALFEMGVGGDLSGAQIEKVAAIRRSIQSALATINDLLELSEAEDGVLTVHPSTVNLPVLVGECLEDYRGAADAAGHTLEIELQTRDLSIRTDPARVRQILANLLSNAIKHTPSGGQIRVELERPATTQEGSATAVLRVIDNGPGIPPDHQDRIFDEFHRLPDSCAQGHGLGLSIARRMAHLIEGDLWVESDGAHGSVFTLVIPHLEALDQPPDPGKYTDDSTD